jgi:HlyD family secretion protein
MVGPSAQKFSDKFPLKLPPKLAPWQLWLGLLGVVGLGGGGVYATRLSVAAPVPITLVMAERGTIESTINETGTVELRGQTTIKSPIEGAVDEVMVRPGQRVKAGQVLVKLRFPERQTALANQQLQIQQQKLARGRQALTQQRQALTQQQQELARQQRQLVVGRSRQRVQEAQEKLAIEERELAKLVVLRDQGAIDQQRVRDQDDRLRTARATLRDAQIAAQDAELTQTNAELAEQAAQLSTQEAQVATNTAQLDLERSLLERQRITQQLQNSVITAPLDGVVLDVKVKDGDGVQFRTDLLTLGDPKQEYIQLQLGTLEAAKVRPSQAARISIIGPDAKTYDGRVLSLYPQAILPDSAGAGSRPGGGQSNQAIVPAVIKLSKPTGVLIPGAQVNAEIILEQKKDVVTLKTEAIQQEGPRAFVWVQDGENRAQKRPVEVGLEGLLAVEVKRGVAAGDRIIVPPVEPALKPGMVVTTEAPPAPPAAGKGKGKK